MKRALLVMAVLLLPALLFAAPEPWGSWGPRGPMPGAPPFFHPEAGPYYKAEVLQIQSEMGQQKVGDLDVNALVSLRERLDVAAQKDDYVNRTALESYFLPGLGQFKTGDTGAGLAFLGADLAVLTATVLGVYYTLPADLRFDRIDYFRNSFSSISSAWNGHSIVDYLPSFGVFVGGMIVDQIIRHWSSDSARASATRRVDNGGVTFTPRIGIGFMGFGLAY